MKITPGKTRKILFVGLLFLLLCLPQTAQATLRVFAEAGTNPTHEVMVQKTVDLFNDILRQDMGATLEKDVRIFLCPTQDNYREVLQRELGQSGEMAARNALISSGFSSAKTNTIALNLDLRNGGIIGQRAYKTAAHELFHQLQNQLAGNKSRGYYWMSEGTADLIGATVAEKVGYQSLDKWRRDQLNTLRQTPAHASPRAILNITLDQWMTLVENKQQPYAVADLMVLYLMKQTGPAGYRAIADYYRRLGQGMSTEEAFFRSFGIEPGKILAGFQVWFDEISVAPAAVEVSEYGSVPREWSEDAQLAVSLARSFLQKTWGQDLISSLRLVVTADKSTYAAAMAKEFGIPLEEAARQAKNTVWRYNGSTIIYDLGSLPAKPDRIYAVASAVLRKYCSDRVAGGKGETLHWLKNALGDVMAAKVVASSGHRTQDNYREAWLTTLRKVTAYPTLAALNDSSAWNQAQITYGSLAVNRVASLAALYLWEKYGANALDRWCEAAKITGGDAAFTQAFGIPVQQFYIEFAQYLSQYVKKAS